MAMVCSGDCPVKDMHSVSPNLPFNTRMIRGTHESLLKFASHYGFRAAAVSQSARHAEQQLFHQIGFVCHLAEARSFNSDEEHHSFITGWLAGCC